MKIKRVFFFISVLCFSLLFTGCGEPLYAMTDEEAEEAEKNNDWSAIEKDKDDYCDDFDWADTEPDWEEDD